MSASKWSEADLLAIECREKRNVRIGNVAAILRKDGLIDLVGNRLVDGALRGLSREDVQDLLVALDGIQGEQPDPPPGDMSDTIIAGAHAVARDVYRLTAQPAIVDVGVHPLVFYRLAGESEADDRSYHMRRADYERGRVRVSREVEISIARELAK